MTTDVLYRYHFDDNRESPSVELTFEEVRDVMKAIGFNILVRVHTYTHLHPRHYARAHTQTHRHTRLSRPSRSSSLVSRLSSLPLRGTIYLHRSPYVAGVQVVYKYSNV